MNQPNKSMWERIQSVEEVSYLTGSFGDKVRAVIFYILFALLFLMVLMASCIYIFEPKDQNKFFLIFLGSISIISILLFVRYIQVKNKKKSKISTEINQGAWIYEDVIDKMGVGVKMACLVSDDILQFNTPYIEESISTLNIRRKGGRLSVFYFITQGQIVSIDVIQRRPIRVRFDNEQPMVFSVIPPSDSSPNVMFILPAKKMIEKIKKSKKMVIEVEFYNEGLRQIEFNTAGLKWD